MPKDRDEDLARTAEVEAAPLHLPDADVPKTVRHSRAPIDPGNVHGAPTHIPPGGPPPLSPPPESWMEGDLSASRATEKTLSVPARTIADRATLTVLTGLHAGQVFALDAAEHVIGRGADADVWIEDPAISRHHAKVTRRPDGRYFVDDLRSTNGTFVGGQRIEGRAELESGERLQVGPNLILRFAITDDAEEELQRRLYESSTRDPLTRVFNRKYFGERLASELAHARRHKTELALLMIDLDRFKAINDTHGHLAGDMVLRVVAAQLGKLIRTEDVLARYGGEEFVVLLRTTALADAAKLGERIRRAVEALLVAEGEARIPVTVSVGVAALAEVAPEGDGAELVALADARLYRAKDAGRNRVSLD